MLSCGIVGLPNSGKSTLFNTLLKRQVAAVASYPFTTIEPNVGVVPVPDERLPQLGKLVSGAKLVPATVKFIDIAGLVKDAHKGEGLGNQFLAKIREVDAIVHLVREFEDPSISHYYGSIDPRRDKEIVDLELALAEIKKPTLYVLNVGKAQSSHLFGEQAKLKASASSADEQSSIAVNAKTGEGVDELIKEAYKLLGLITFYSIKGGKEITAWALPQGQTALEAAAKIHTEIAKGFIKAEVVAFNDLVAAAGWQQTRASGKIRLEGRDYRVLDGDVIEFKFTSKF